MGVQRFQDNIRGIFRPNENVDLLECYSSSSISAPDPETWNHEDGTRDCRETVMSKVLTKT